MAQDEFTKQRAIAWVRLLANAKVSPITIRYCSLSDKGLWLWQATNDRGEYLALQGTETQVVASLAAL